MELKHDTEDLMFLDAASLDPVPEALIRNIICDTKEESNTNRKRTKKKPCLAIRFLKQARPLR